MNNKMTSQIISLSFENNKTYLSQFDNYVDDIKTFVKELEELLHQKMTKRKTENGIEAVFDGDQRTNIKNYIAQKFNIPENMFILHNVQTNEKIDKNEPIIN